MTYIELLEQHEARLRLYAGLIDTMSGEDEATREPVVDLMRREVAATEKLARERTEALRGENEREAFRYSLMLMLPYYTHLARIYGKHRRGVSTPARTH